MISELQREHAQCRLELTSVPAEGDATGNVIDEADLREVLAAANRALDRLTEQLGEATSLDDVDEVFRRSVGVTKTLAATVRFMQGDCDDLASAFYGGQA